MDYMITELNVENLCAIIEVCGRCGVSELELEKLKIKFHHVKNTAHTMPTVVPTAQGQEKVAEISKDFDLPPKMEAEIKQAQLDYMMVEDPVAYEDLLLSGDLENESE